MMVRRIRNWLIRGLAGRDTIIINARIKHGVIWPQPYFKGAGQLMFRVEFDGRADRARAVDNRYDGRFNLKGDLEAAREDGRDTENEEDMAEFYEVTLYAYTRGQELERDRLARKAVGDAAIFNAERLARLNEQISSLVWERNVIQKLVTGD